MEFNSTIMFNTVTPILHRTMIFVLKFQAEFDAALMEAGNKLVVVDFTASWCPPCRAIGPKFEVQFCLHHIFL